MASFAASPVNHAARHLLPEHCPGLPLMILHARVIQVSHETNSSCSANYL
jgi:hypothetical protein